MLFVQDPGLPAPFGDTLYSVDWGTNFIYRHPLQPNGATFTAGQEVFLGLPRPTDIAHRRRLAALRGELEGRAVSLRRRADRLHRAPDASRRQGRRRCPTSRPRATRGSSSSSRRPIRFTAASRSTSWCAAGRRRSASRCSRSACSAPGSLAGPRVRDLHVEAAGRRRLARRRSSRRRPIRRCGRSRCARWPIGASELDRRAEGALRAGARRRQSARAAPGDHRAEAPGRRRTRPAAILPLTASTDPVVPHVAIDALVALGASDAALARADAPSTPRRR